MNLNDYFNEIKGKKIAVIGIGISNLPLIKLMAAEGVDVTACDRRTFSELGQVAIELINNGIKLKLGSDYLKNLNFDIIFRTPSLMPYKINSSAKITSEMELFLSLCPCKVVAVTGSDGKTTTATIINKLLSAQGYTVHLGGNIGNPLLCELPFFKKDDFAVVELSSFQLNNMYCKPDISVITNISPNHLDIHKDYEDYINSKKQIFVNQDENGVLVLNKDDVLVSTFGGNRFFSMTEEVDGCYCINGEIFRDGHYLMNTADILLPGNHNIMNYLAAFASTINYVSDETCIEIAKTFKGVEHRLERVDIINGVTYINDSIGTSPTRTIAGLHALNCRPIVILGGYDKKIPFDELASELKKYAKAVVLTGDTADILEKAVVHEGEIVYYKYYDFDEAFKCASSIAEYGDTVLLSPACSSFDRFPNFEVRGNYFKKLVEDLKN